MNMTRCMDVWVNTPKEMKKNSNLDFWCFIHWFTYLLINKNAQLRELLELQQVSLIIIWKY